VWIVDSVAADSDASAVWVCFVWADGAYDLCECDFVAAFVRDGVIGYSVCRKLVGCKGLGNHDRYLGRGGRLRLRMMYSKCRRTWDVFVVSDIRGHCRCCRQGRGRLKVSAHLVPTRGGLLAFESQRNVSILSVCDGRRECRSFVQFWNACGWQWVLDWLGVLTEEC